MTTSAKMAVFGLDCASPELVFGELAEKLPNIRGLVASGCRARLKSTDPPITVPAWTSMTTGKDPGELGLYGFRNRLDHSYDELTTCNNSAVKCKRVWDVLADQGLRSIVVGVPQTFPPGIENGVMISGFMTPSAELDFTAPPEVKDMLEAEFPGYQLDVGNFRQMDREELFNEIVSMTRQRFDVVRHLCRAEQWDFLMMVEIGLDRLHHAFWRPDNSADDRMVEYYQLLDDEIGKTVAEFPAGTSVMVVSDHGAKAMRGGFCINDWLIREGHLVLKDGPPKPGPLSHSMIDWTRTKAWGAGGYYARVFLNIEGREPSGAIPRDEMDGFRDGLARDIEAIRGPDDEPWENRVIFPARVYREVRGVPPDMMVYFDDLGCRSIGSVGHPRLWTEGDDRGVDLANHSEEGIFVWNKAGMSQGNVIPITGVFDMILTEFGVDSGGGA